MIVHKWLIILLIFSLTIRIWGILFSLGFRENTDVLRYKDWTRNAYLYGAASTYTNQHLTYGIWGNNQPPGSLYILEGAYQAELLASKLYARFTHTIPGENLFINGPLVTIFLRLPSILSDLAIAAMLYAICLLLKVKKDWAVGAAALFLFNPVVVYNSAVWGQTDNLNNLFFIASLLFLARKKILWSIIFFFLSLFIKFSLLFLLPFYLLLIWKISGKMKKVALSSIISLILLIILSLPISSDPRWLFTIVSHASGEMQNITAFAFNFWWVIYKPVIHLVSLIPNTFNFAEVRITGSPHVKTIVFGLPLIVWSMVLFFLSLSPAIVGFYKKKALTVTDAITLSAIVLLCGFLFLPRMHERYLYPIFAPLAILVALQKQNIWLYIGLAILNFINIYTVWHPFALEVLPMSLLAQQNFQWCISLATAILGGVFYIRCLMQSKQSDV